MNVQTKVSDIMTREVVSLFEEDNLETVARSLDRFRFHHLPVVDGRKVVGIVSQRDLLRNTVAGIDQSAAARTRENRFLEKTFVRDVMQTEVVTALADEAVSVAAGRMLRARIAFERATNRLTRTPQPFPEISHAPLSEEARRLSPLHGWVPEGAPRPRPEDES